MKFPSLIAAFSVLLALFPALSARPQSSTDKQAAADAAAAEENRQELVNLEKETVRALLLNNATFFKRVYGDDFLGTTSTGRVIDKNTYLASVASSLTKYSVFIASDIQVRIFLDTAVVNCLWTARGTQSGQSFDRQYRVTHVYIYGQRGWQAIASQETLLPG
jgi:ketosteroid isomerase-like protein